MKLLFVCTGNICRSPTAEGVMRHLIEAAGLAHEVDSAGTHDYHVGEAPDARTIRVAAKRGYDLSALVARRIHHRDYHHFDLLLALDREHHRLLRRAAPSGTEDKVHLFLEYAAVTGYSEVPDPYYGGEKDFEHVLDVIEQGCHGILRKLEA